MSKENNENRDEKIHEVKASCIPTYAIKNRLNDFRKQADEVIDGVMSGREYKEVDAHKVMNRFEELLENKCESVAVTKNEFKAIRDLETALTIGFMVDELSEFLNHQEPMVATIKLPGGATIDEFLKMAGIKKEDVNIAMVKPKDNNADKE